MRGRVQDDRKDLTIEPVAAQGAADVITSALEPSAGSSGKAHDARSAAEVLDFWFVTRRECLAMMRHLLASGVRVPQALVVKLTATSGDNDDPKRLAELVDLHGRLADLVAPATPRAILVLAEEARSGWWRFLGPVRIARQLAVTALGFITAFVALSLSPAITHDSGDLFASAGWPLLVNLLFLAAAAGLGATFAMLFKVVGHVTRRTYDPSFDTSYWSQLVLGVIAGLFLAELISEAADGALGGLMRPLLALLGGFSASLVYRVLNRLVETVEQLFQGSTQELIDRVAQEARLRGARARARSQLQLAGDLMQVQRALVAGGDGTDAAERVQAMLDTLLGSLGEAPAAGGDSDERLSAERTKAKGQSLPS